MSVVAVCRCPGYENARDAIERALRLLGGGGNFAKPGQKVLVKPNLLTSAAPEKAVTTHPAVLDAVLAILSDLGAKPQVGDSPGLAGAKTVAKTAGLLEIAKRHGAPLIDLGDPPCRELGIGLFKDLHLSAKVFEADAVWNLPKWKTHTMMGLTLGVKNLYGCVQGKRKAAGHLRVGRNHDAFARMLIDIWEKIAPCLTILDGVTAMHGAGPGHGKPIGRGLILASPHAPSLDYIASGLSGFAPESVQTIRLTIENGIIDPASVTIAGDEAEVMRFEPAPGSASDFSLLPGPLKRVLRTMVSPAPEFSADACIDCGICAEACPADALKKGKPPALDKERCIRCYCCQELCPEGAVTVASALLLGRK